ncbi:hypothetical protein ACVIRO_001288 [Rhizobium ruizarguesonis]
MRGYPITRRLTERPAFCRGCDDEMPKGTPIVTTFSWRNRGQHIHFCITCAETIGKLAQGTAE